MFLLEWLPRDLLGLDTWFSHLGIISSHQEHDQPFTGKWLGLNRPPYPGTARLVSGVRVLFGFHWVGTELINDVKKCRWNMENMQSIESKCLFCANICCIWHFRTLLGEVYVLFSELPKVFSFSFDSPTVFFFFFWSSEAYLNFLCSDHLRLWLWKSNYVFGFVFFFFSVFFVLYQLLCPVPSLQVPGIPLASGKQEDCLLYLVTIATGLECEAIMVALHGAEGRSVARGCCWVCGGQSWHVLGICAVCPLHW